MGKIVKISQFKDPPPGNLSALKPWEFRRADWDTPHFIQMLKSQSAKLEKQRKEILRLGKRGGWQIPSHFKLDGGMAYTIRALFAYRENEDLMREIYFLTGLMDCMINQVNPVLRTDVLRDMYKKIFLMKKDLNLHWYGPLDQVFLPIDTHFYNEHSYRASLRNAKTLKSLYRAIRQGTDDMFKILSLNYVLYCPSVGR